MMYHRLTISIVAFVALAVCLAAFFVWPALNAVKAISNDIAAKKARIVFLEEQERASQDFQKKYEGYKTNLEAAERLFADKNNPIGLIEFIESIARETGAQIQINLSPLEEKGILGRPSIFFDLMARGNFSSLQAFTQALENGPYLIAVQKATIKKSAEEFQEKIISPGLLQTNFFLAIIIK